MCGHKHYNNQNWQGEQQSAAADSDDKARRGQTEPLGQSARYGGESDTRRFDQSEVDAAAQSQQQNYSGQANQQYQQPVNNAPGHGYWGRGWGFPWWAIFFIWPLFGWLGRAFSDSGDYYGWGHGFMSSGFIWPLLILGAIILIGRARRGGFRRW